MLRKLAARIAAISVSVVVDAGFDPEQFAYNDPTGNFWLLRSGFYQSDRGNDLASSEGAPNSNCSIF
jgi:hypothetical protein